MVLIKISINFDNITFQQYRPTSFQDVTFMLSLIKMLYKSAYHVLIVYLLSIAQLKITFPVSEYWCFVS